MLNEFKEVVYTLLLGTIISNPLNEDITSHLQMITDVSQLIENAERKPSVYDDSPPPSTCIQFSTF